MSKHSFDSVIFDLDGVVTRTAKVHAKAWKITFDEYLRVREKRDNEAFREFTHQKDYLPFVDGKPRYQGVKSFLESRKINISYGNPADSAEKETICGLGNKKNKLFNEILKKEGAEVFTSSVELIRKLKDLGIRVGVASSSKNCKEILESVGLEKLFETRVDGVVSEQMGLKGKPEGDIFVVAANNLEAEPAYSVVVEDAVSGVQAGRNGGFGLVLGVARENNQNELLENGADIAVSDLSDITIEWIEEWFKREPYPLFKYWDEKGQLEFSPEAKSDRINIFVNPCYTRSPKDTLFKHKQLVFFLDYDGTLTPIVEKPELAVISKDMQDTVKKLSKMHTVAIVSGRAREDVQKLAGIPDIFYAGSHGFDILGPGFSVVQPKAKESIPLIAKIIDRLSNELKDINGVLVEKKKLSVAVHYRLAQEKHLPEIKKLVSGIVDQHKGTLRIMKGKKVFEILPNINWDKGQAIRWIIDALKISWQDSAVVYIGDDLTDEYAFRMLRTRGLSILVSENPKTSSADFQVSSVQEVRRLFEEIIELPS